MLTKVLGREPGSVAVLREEIKTSPRVRRLLSERDEDRKVPFRPYAKWYGAHWVLAERLLLWQWPDGGWNCDKNPEAAHLSFMESLIPLRALALHSRLRRNERSRAAAERAAEVFLGRRMYPCSYPFIGLRSRL